jgi:hypothetical protein
VAFVRSGTTARFFVNGTQAGADISMPGALYNSSSPMTIGVGLGSDMNPNGVTYVNGLLDDVRITKAARYTGSFTPSRMGTAL